MGIGSDGKAYGWSHRAFYGFGIGDTVDKNTCGNIKGDKTWKIKSERDAVKQAIAFAADIA